jgi:hypothetical protein
MKNLGTTYAISGNVGNFCIHFPSNLVLHTWGNKLKMVSFGKFMAHGCDPQKCGEFLCIFSYTIWLCVCSETGIRDLAKRNPLYKLWNTQE